MPLRNPWPNNEEEDSDDGVPAATFSNPTLQSFVIRDRKAKKLAPLYRRTEGALNDETQEVCVKIRSGESKERALHDEVQTKGTEHGIHIFTFLFARCSSLAFRVAKSYVILDGRTEYDNAMMLLKFQFAKKLHADLRMILDKQTAKHRFNWLNVVVCLCEVTAHIYQQYGFASIVAGSIFDIVVADIIRRPHGCLLAWALRDSQTVTRRQLWLTACVLNQFLPFGYDVLTRDACGVLLRQRYRLNDNLRVEDNLFPLICCDAEGNFCAYSGYARLKSEEFLRNSSPTKLSVSISAQESCCHSVETGNNLEESDELEFTDQATTDCTEKRISRRQRRCKQIRFLKRTFEYKEYLMYRRRRTLTIRGISENMPATPDPFDESISRSTWEKNKAIWRKAFCSYVYKS